MSHAVGLFSRRPVGFANLVSCLAFLREGFVRSTQMSVADNLDPSADHDKADNQSKDKVRKSGFGERDKDTTNYCSEIGQSVVFREYPTSANMHLPRAMLLQK